MLENFILNQAVGYEHFGDVYSDFTNLLESNYVPYLGPLQSIFGTGLRRLNQFKEAYIGTTIYVNSSKPTTNFILLGNRGRNASRGLINVSDTDFVNNFGIINNQRGMAGSILNTVPWNLFYNDMFVLGAISREVPFYLVTNRNIDSLTAFFSDTGQRLTDFANPLAGTGNEKRLSIYGREILGPLLAGYKLVKPMSAHEHEGLVPNPDGIRGLTLKEYTDALNFFEKSNKWKILLRRDLVSIDFNFETNTVNKFIFE